MLIGRKNEIKILQEVLHSPKAEMIAMLGRRRVGKTYLIDTLYKDHIIFKQTGVRHAPDETQLRTFVNKLKELSGEEIKPIDNWLDAFFAFKKVLQPLLNKEKKQVIFFDELSWLATPESKFLDFLGHFWNDWAYQQNLVVVLCGSASSWIIQQVINDKGGLHNRVTKYIHLKPFSLYETEEYFNAKFMRFTRYQIVQMYMAFGGIPWYLEEVNGGKSAIQNINDICFAENGLLRNEFDRLYPALFEKADHHIAVVRALASSHKGLSRTEIIDIAKIPNGSTTTRVLKELEQTDFIMAFHPFGKKKKDKIYRLADEYSNFYLRFIEHTAYEGQGTFMQLSQLQTYKIWCGYAFEGICMKHVPQIKKALGISGVYTTTHSYLRKSDGFDRGLQIDMLIERADRVINLFEIKFYNTEFVFSEAYGATVQERWHLFMRVAKTKCQVRVVMITPYGVKHNMHSLGLVDPVLNLDALFLTKEGHY